MEYLSAILFSLYSLAILAESMFIESSTIIETLWDNAHDVRDIKNYHVNLKQNIQNNTKYPLIDENPVKNSTQESREKLYPSVGEHAKDPLYLNNASNAFTISTGDFLSSNIKDMHSRHNGDKENDADPKEPSEDLSSHDILLDPSLIPARLSRQTKKSDADYSNLASIENIPSKVKFNNHGDSRSIFPLKRNLNYEDDLSVAEDKYLPYTPYPYWNSYYRKQFPNQRYRMNDRRERYRNYWRYPVFPGK